MCRLLILGIFFTLFVSGETRAQETHSHINSAVTVLNDSNDRDLLDSFEKNNDSLYEALGLAYQNNPTLRAARAELLAVEEQLPQAQAGFKPTITAEGDATHTNTKTEGNSFISSDGSDFSQSAAVNLNQPLFRGGSTIADISEAKNTINAQLLSLSATEQSILYDSAVAYMNVLRDQAILKLNKNNHDLVKRELEQARNRFRVGELTRTDVSQSEARLANANAEVINANGVLKSSAAIFRQVIGTAPPYNMAYPKTTLALPNTLEEVLSLAESNNRAILQAKFQNAAAEDSVDSIFGELLPQISAVGRLSKVYDQTDFLEEQRQESIGVSASIPLYEAGSTRSRIREAKKRANQRYIQIIEAQDQARQEALSNWETLQAAQAETKARQAQIEASRIAREGVHYEAEFGERTTLDALDANQELLDAQVSYITAKRNEVVARFALARSLGLLVPQNLGFSTINP